MARWLGGSVARRLGGSAARWLGGSAARRNDGIFRISNLPPKRFDSIRCQISMFSETLNVRLQPVSHDSEHETPATYVSDDSLH